MDISGQWTGIIIYGKGYPEDHGRKLFFDLDIQQQGQNIIGLASDTSGAGIHPDPAKIKGSFKDNKINFIKRYPCRHYAAEGGTTIIDRSKPGSPIYYSGTYDTKTGKFNGEWLIKLALFGIIPLPRFYLRGTWEMSKKSV